MEPNNALKNPFTSNPGVTAPANISNKALITSEKSPNVKKFIGNEINCTNGFIKRFITAIITQANIADKKLFTEIPGIIQAIKIIKTEKIIHFKNSFIIHFLLL